MAKGLKRLFERGPDFDLRLAHWRGFWAWVALLAQFAIGGIAVVCFFAGPIDLSLLLFIVAYLIGIEQRIIAIGERKP